MNSKNAHDNGIPPVLVFSGGIPPGGPQHSEAAAMREYAHRCHGLHGAWRVLLEDGSHTTRENALYSLRMLSEEGLAVSSLAVVTNLFHARRACGVFRRAARDSGLRVYVQCVGLPSSAAAPSGTCNSIQGDNDGGREQLIAWPIALRIELGYLLLREPAALVVYWTRGWL